MDHKNEFAQRSTALQSVTVHDRRHASSSSSVFAQASTLRPSSSLNSSSSSSSTSHPSNGQGTAHGACLPYCHKYALCCHRVSKALVSAAHCKVWKSSRVWFTVLLLSCVATTLLMYSTNRWPTAATFSHLHVDLGRLFLDTRTNATKASSQPSASSTTTSQATASASATYTMVTDTLDLADPPRSFTMPHNRNVAFGDDPRWLPLDKKNPDIFVYAAYFDDVESTSYVRLLVAATITNLNEQVRCLYFEADDYQQPVLMTIGRLQSYNKWPTRKMYRGAFVKCPILKLLPRPHAISIVRNCNDDITACNTDVTSVLHVYYGVTRMTGSPRWNVTKCFPALHKYNQVMQLIQQVEISRTLGVEHFLFYNLSASRDISIVIDYYREQGVADLLDWHYPAPMYNSKYFNQMEAIQDCIQRHVHSSRYLLLGDMDEIMVPRKSQSIVPLLDQLFTSHPECGTFRFLNTFFPLIGVSPKLLKSQKTQSFPKFSLAVKNKLDMLLTQYRINDIWSDGKRAKLAVLPKTIEAGGIHDNKSHRLSGNYTSCNVPENLSLLHHYRTKVPPLPKAHNYKNVGMVHDTSLLRFSPEIMARIQRVINDLKDTITIT